MRLVAQPAGRLAADRKPHPGHPVAHAAAEPDLPAFPPHRLGLQIEQDQPGAGAIGHAEQRRPAAADLQPPRLDQQRAAVAGAAPGLVIGQPLVRQGGEAPAGIGDAEALGVLGHDLGGDIDQAALPDRHHLPCLLSPMRQDEPVDFPHEPTPPQSSPDAGMQSMPAPSGSTVGLTSRVLVEGFFTITGVSSPRRP